MTPPLSFVFSYLAFIKPYTYLIMAARGCPTSHNRVSSIRRVLRVDARWVGAPPAEEGGNADLLRPLSYCAMEMVASQTHAACVQADPGGPPLARTPPARREKRGLGYRLLVIPDAAATPRGEGRWNPGGARAHTAPKGKLTPRAVPFRFVCRVADAGPDPEGRRDRAQLKG
jgi:hypothetical protein